jgi:hypothetical protein
MARATLWEYRPLSASFTAITPGGKRAPFQAPWESTVELLTRELRYLQATTPVIELDVDQSAIRDDGGLYASAKPVSPGVRLSFGSRHGPLAYTCGTYIGPGGDAIAWKHNVRAVALSLEALRKVDRYGVTRKGEQYRGWRQLTVGDGPDPAAREAALVVVDLAGGLPGDVDNVIAQPEAMRELYRRAARRAHPDHGGAAVTFARLQRARAVLDDHHGRA